MLSDPWFWAAGIAAVVVLGLSKGGFMGLGTLATPLLAMAVSPVRSAAILLPILVVQDLVSVWAFRRAWDGHVLAVLLPGAAAGILLGYLFAASIPERGVLAALGAISVIFALWRLWLERGGRLVAPRRLSDRLGLVCGLASGLTSQIAHAGYPPFQIWVMPRQLARDTLVGTSAIFFAVVNWIKVPAYVALGQFNAANAAATAALLPVAIGSTFAGVQLVRRAPAARFQTIIYLLTVLVGLKLLWSAFA
jgi:uncharacterized membrane protein YfcA